MDKINDDKSSGRDEKMDTSEEKPVVTNAVLVPKNNACRDETLFGWGSTNHGQLAMGGIEEECICSPKRVSSLSESPIEISIGAHHTLFLTRAGAVYSCGNNDDGQLGQQVSRRRPEKVSALDSQVITQLASGELHNLAMSDVGNVFSWGCNHQGQIGRDKDKDDEIHHIPKLVKTISMHNVIQVSCGAHHSLALTDTGHVLSWGMNKHGQLGLGTVSLYVDHPEVLVSLQGIPVRQIASGGYHSFILSQSGAVFGWGKNDFGQLGIGTDRSSSYPVQCKSLRSQRVKYVACGDEHTAILTADGGVFTFGAGSCGQLGHNSINNEFLPRKVFEVMGSTVTQIACGRRHTLVLIAYSGRLFSFGLNGNGQLGVGDILIRKTPAPTKGHWVPANFSSKNSDHQQIPTEGFIIRRIFSGGDHCFVIASRPQPDIRPYDHRIIPAERRILHLNNDLINSISMVSPQSKPSQEVLDQVEKIFSNSSCLNASFLLLNDEHYNASSKKSGVDVLSAMKSFSSLNMAGNMSVNNLACSSMENQLLAHVKCSPPDVEAMRFYLTLPLSRYFEHPDDYCSLLCTFGHAMLSLEANAAKVIDSWWSRLEVNQFTRLILIYKKVVIYILDLPVSLVQAEVEVRQRHLCIAMDMLKKINTVNNKHNVVPYEQFYINELKDRVDIRMDYVNWLKQQNKYYSGQGILSFCDYSFALDAQAKTLLLQTDAIIQMRNAMDEVARRNFAGLFNSALPIDPINPCLVLFVTRKNIVQDTVNQLTKHGSVDLKKPLKVIFVDEDAIDAGGVRKEFFLLIMREIMNPQYGMFRYFEESRLLWFNDRSFEDPCMFNLIGKICGLAIYNSIIIDLNFPLSLYKKLLNQPATLEDLKDLEPVIGRSLEDMLEYYMDDFEDVFPMNFEIEREVFGEIVKIPLVENGDTIHLTMDNRKEYVDAYIDYVFNKSVREPFQRFAEGFMMVIGGRVLEFFHAQELQAMVVGNENYDFSELEANCEYKGEFYTRHPSIRMFWEVFHELPLESKRKFLLFLTGSDRIPILGMNAVKIHIQCVGGGEDYLPVAHTCFNLLDLPKYSNKEILRTKLLQAIEHTEGFGIV
ncbi:putative E3 ubiquitin-protein ligase HERC4 isoform X2 [Tubulanus polymorphus]|uniref:putative E3 ubiquitin-protein ligase HERC4 isoform X2 n=1 Tax=Tubulanus polymorphus TaxID=672921 RepID=UPI003DA334CE